LLKKVLELKASAKIFTANVDRPYINYEAHRRRESLWKNLDNLSVPVYKKVNDVTGGHTKIRFTKVSKAENNK
jgi:hypothetical protein